MTVKNIGTVSVNVTVTFTAAMLQGPTFDTDEDTGEIKPNGQGEAKKEWIIGSMIQPEATSYMHTEQATGKCAIFVIAVRWRSLLWFPAYRRPPNEMGLSVGR